MLKLKKLKKGRKLPQNVEPVPLEDLNYAQVRLILLYDSIAILIHSTKGFQNFHTTAKMSQVILVFL